jgi:hypothetical protein
MIVRRQLDVSFAVQDPELNLRSAVPGVQFLWGVRATHARFLSCSWLRWRVAGLEAICEREEGFRHVTVPLRASCAILVGVRFIVASSIRGTYLIFCV